MSNFSSILASLGSKNEASKPVSTPQSRPSNKPASATAAPTGNEKAHTTSVQDPKSSGGLKRKAEDISSTQSVKAPLYNAPNPIAKSQTAATASKSSNIVRVPSKQSVPSTSEGNEKAGQTIKAPPKGSFREIMARAEAAKQRQMDFGQIKHKPVEKLSKKERRKREEEAKAASRLKTATTGSIGIKVKPQMPNGASSPAAKKKPDDLGYRGTMRPAPSEPAYKGTIKQSGPGMGNSKGISGSKLGSGKSSSRPYSESRYVYAEDMDSEEESDYSDDMEAAGFDELEEEEQQSLRVAKKEDEEALRQEEEHRRQKAERKRKLEQLSASRKR